MEERMFEFIMLFAFLYAASCQLFPKRPVATKTQSGGKKHLVDRTTAGRHREVRQSPLKRKSRSHEYARAA